MDIRKIASREVSRGSKSLGRRIGIKGTCHEEDYNKRKDEKQRFIHDDDAHCSTT